VFRAFVEISGRAATVVLSSALFPCASRGIGEGAVDARRRSAFLSFADLDVLGFRTFVGEKLHRSPRFLSDEVSHVHHWVHLVGRTLAYVA
jgi:hypothetical protein